MNLQRNAYRKAGHGRKAWKTTNGKTNHGSPGLEALKRQALARRQNWVKSKASLAETHIGEASPSYASPRSLEN